jgi:hypothetical protein
VFFAVVGKLFFASVGVPDSPTGEDMCSNALVGIEGQVKAFAVPTTQRNATILQSPYLFFRLKPLYILHYCPSRLNRDGN